ncbi:MAG: sulfotransferase family protein [Gemmataceae bacterium]
MSSVADPNVVPKPKQKARRWAPRIWMGCSLHAWWQLLWRNRCAVHWPYWHILATDTPISVINSTLWLLQDIIHGRRLAQTPIPQAPVFIIGHWRTGTTFLHELLIQDPRHNYPTTYQCMAPHHFLISEWILPRLLWFLMPDRRPMDNVATGWDRPQEDEFALCMLGQPSPYLTIAFPNHPPCFEEYYDLETLTPAALAAWKQAFLGFLQRLSYRDPRRLILKSPPHTCRIKTLVDLFPDARFIHIVRNPYVVYPSTVNLWKSLYRAQGFQRPNFAGLEEQVFTRFLHFYERLDTGRRYVAPKRFFEIRYEDLLTDPAGHLHTMYEELELGDFETARPCVDNYLSSVADYETNRYDLPSELRATITNRWGAIIRRYGYEDYR